MQAVVITRPGGPEVLQVVEVPDPRPGTREILVSVRAAGLNRLDLLQRMGLYPAPPGAPADVPGVEYAGVVEDCGYGVSLHKKGDRVCGLVGGGAYAQYLAVHESTAMPIPGGLSDVEAAAVPEAFVTAYDAMLLQAGLRRGEAVLIHAVGSGVGSAAVQIAACTGARAIGTARSARKLELARTWGLNEGTVPVEGRFADHVLSLTGQEGVNVVLDLVGGAYVPESMKCMASRGRMIVVGLVAGAGAEIDLGLLLRKRLELRGTVLRARALEEKIALTEKFAAAVLPFFSSGRLKPVVDRVFPLKEAAQAHTYLASNENFGKVVLEVP